MQYLHGRNSYTENDASLSTVTADANGTASFAFFGAGDREYYHALSLTAPGEEKAIDLGRKKLLDKVYNITRTVSETK